MRIALIGCGLIGKKRVEALRRLHEDSLILTCDIEKEKAESFAKEYHCDSTTRWQDAVERHDVDIIIVATINSEMENIVVSALENKKHVLCEKPLGRNTKEAERMVQAAERNSRLLKTGFNHIFHPALWKAKELLEQGAIGKLSTIRARYGHGSRPGMEHEWRSSKALCGGGELLDQGVHVIDLIRWFAGEVRQVYGKVETKFWNIEVEDNAFVILTCENQVTAMFHVSWTNWKNIFSFELFGTDGYLHIHGLGGSYGQETLEYGKRKPEGGKPDIKTFIYEEPDTSWDLEWKEFRTSIQENRQPLKNGLDGLRANQIIEAIYTSHRTNLPVMLERT